MIIININDIIFIIIMIINNTKDDADSNSNSQRSCHQTHSLRISPRNGCAKFSQQYLANAWTKGVAANFVLFDRLFGVLPLIYFYLPRRARAYLFLQSVKIHYFCSGLL